LQGSQPWGRRLSLYSLLIADLVFSVDTLDFYYFNTYDEYTSLSFTETKQL